MFKGGIAGAMKQAQRMQAEMAKAQEELANIVVVGEAGAGMVKIEMTCRHVVKGIRLDDSIMNDDKDMLEDLIGAAFNDALAKVEKTSTEAMSKVTGGLDLPAGMKFPGM